MINKIWEFFFDKDQTAFKKIILFFVGVSGLLFADYFFRFSDSYIAEKKIEQLDKIQQILKEDSLSNQVKTELRRLEKDIVKRQGFWDLAESFTSLTQQMIISPKQKNATNKPTNPITEKVEKVEKIIYPVRSIFWHTLSSAWFIFVIMLMLPFALFTDKKLNFNLLINLIFIEAFLYLIAQFFSFLFAKIPVFDYPILNYLFNFTIPLVFFILIGFYAKYKKEQT